MHGSWGCVCPTGTKRKFGFCYSIKAAGEAATQERSKAQVMIFQTLGL